MLGDGVEDIIMGGKRLLWLWVGFMISLVALEKQKYSQDVANLLQLGTGQRCGPCCVVI